MQCRSMPLVSNFDMVLYYVMKGLCENFRLIACCVVKLQLVKVRKLDVCGSLVLSNSVTIVAVLLK